MLKCMCDLCNAELGTLKAEEVGDRPQLKVTMSGINLYIGDICDTCLSRLKALLNVSKE